VRLCGESKSRVQGAKARQQAVRRGAFTREYI
jgi:hypothetical protein